MIGLYKISKLFVYTLGFVHKSITFIEFQDLEPIASGQADNDAILIPLSLSTQNARLKSVRKRKDC
jgi:hypothetical protein